MKFDKSIFFPFPIYLNIKKKFDKSCIEGKKVGLYFKENKVCDYLIEEKYSLNMNEKIKNGKKIFGTNKLSHPGFSKFINEKGIYLSGKILNFNKKLISKINFSKPNEIKKKIKKLNKIAGFHTRNVPHKGHEWIHNLGVKKCGNILIQPIVGHFKKGEYSEQAVIEGNKHLVKKRNYEFKKNLIKYKFFFSFINIQPRYAGPREALLHALIRKNYGCTHFLVGRDHAGYKNFYKEYASQKLCKKYQNKLKIKIIKYKSPKICLTCKIITDKKCNCLISSKKQHVDINGSNIRNLIKRNKKIPNYLFDKTWIKKIPIKKVLH